MCGTITIKYFVSADNSPEAFLTVECVEGLEVSFVLSFRHVWIKSRLGLKS